MEDANLPSINLRKLLSDSSRVRESTKLYSAAVSAGFFYLQLNQTDRSCSDGSIDSTSADILSEAHQIFSLMNNLFDLPIEEKKEYDVSKNDGYFGYKGMGMSFIDEHGTLDTNEFYNISKDDMLGRNSNGLRQPQIVEENRTLLRSFIVHCHQIVTILLRELSAALELKPIRDADQQSSDVLPNLHRLTVASGDQISLIKYPVPEFTSNSQPLASHTDYGSITLIFTTSPGLQVLKENKSSAANSQTQSQWYDIPPKNGYAIVNCGDALSLFSGNVIRSNVHRVTSHASRGSSSPRYSLGYFARPENDQILRPLRSPLIQTPHLELEKTEGIRTSEWILRRSYGRLLDRYQGKESWVATTGTEKM